MVNGDPIAIGWAMKACSKFHRSVMFDECFIYSTKRRKGNNVRGEENTKLTLRFCIFFSLRECFLK